MKEIKIQVSADGKSLQVVKQTHRGRAFGSKESNDPSTFRHADVAILESGCESNDMFEDYHDFRLKHWKESDIRFEEIWGQTLYVDKDGRLVEYYGPEAGKVEPNKMPILRVRATREEWDMEPVTIPSEAWLRAIRSAIYAYNCTFGPEPKPRKGSKTASK